MPLLGTMQEQAYELLRKDILNLVLEPGTPITIQGIADRMEVSRTPVREALIRLEKDALVRFTPQRGILITYIDLERVRQERFLREHLETIVLERFLQVDVPEAWLRLDALLARQKQAAEKQDAVDLIQLDDEFHRTFYCAIRQALNWEMQVWYSTHYRRLRLLHVKNCDMVQIVAEHQELVQALRDGSLEQATSLLQKHLHHLDGQIDSLRQANPNYFLEEREWGGMFRRL